MDEFDYTQIDEGIRDVVRSLREAGFDTCDSGDGTKDDMGCALDYPNVSAIVDVDTLVEEGDRMLEVLGDDWIVQASYSPNDGYALLHAYQPSERIKAELRDMIHPDYLITDDA